MKCSRRRKNTMHFFSLHLLRENDTMKSLQMAVAVTKYRYITFQVELSTLNSTRFDSVVKETDSIRFDSVFRHPRFGSIRFDSLNMFFGLIRLGSVRLSRTEPNRIVEYSVRFRPLIHIYIYIEASLSRFFPLFFFFLPLLLYDHTRTSKNKSYKNQC